MAAITPRRLQAAVSVVGACIEAHIQRHTDQASECRNLLFALQRLEVPANVPTAGPTAPRSSGPVKKGIRPAAGSLPARILDIVGELDDAVTTAQIMERKPGADVGAVRHQIGRLVKAGWLTATGSTNDRRFSLPTRKAGK